jgi:iron complex transport system permease protein
MFINYLVPHGQRGQMALWLMGYLNENVSQWTLLTAMAVTGGGIAAATWLGRSMDAASFSDAEARSLGVDLGRLRMWMFVLAGVLTAGAVMLAGPVGFVGLIAPHAVRMVMGPAHRPLIPASALAGVVLVVGADAAIRLLNIGGGLMPIGIITAIIGGPVFLFMLRGQLRRRIGP